VENRNSRYRTTIGEDGTIEAARQTYLEERRRGGGTVGHCGSLLPLLVPRTGQQPSSLLTEPIDLPVIFFFFFRFWLYGRQINNREALPYGCAYEY